MKRIHLHLSVEDLGKSISFYNSLFGALPTVTKPDYAKWMLDDPLVNFAISQRGTHIGLDHIGIQVESEAELSEIKERLELAEMHMLTQKETICCYAKSDKHWVQDPTGIAWETYRTLDSAPTFNGSEAQASVSACCAPTPQTIQFATRKP
ncbi:MAG TPA: glyoxalase/bleomycin resistance/dioxygenase family protein [Methylophilaceae bacterium]|nr:glyoxalase/bleomycin resistance/dioxygenase family protein [Methylophilaceae bacterium]HAJ70775.1 glyoxalase/bleomycin resistance/dioxygenase family protein [Methylophilaceae bacterium]